MKLLHKYIIISYILDGIFYYLDEANGHFYIVTEYCEGGNIFQRMKTQRENGFFEEQQVIVSCRDTVHTMGKYTFSPFN